MRVTNRSQRINNIIWPPSSSDSARAMDKSNSIVPGGSLSCEKGSADCLHGKVAGQSDLTSHECMDAWTHGCKDVWTHGCMDAWIYGCLNVWMY